MTTQKPDLSNLDDPRVFTTKTIIPYTKRTKDSEGYGSILPTSYGQQNRYAFFWDGDHTKELQEFLNKQNSPFQIKIAQPIAMFKPVQTHSSKIKEGATVADLIGLAYLLFRSRNDKTLYGHNARFLGDACEQIMKLTVHVSLKEILDELLIQRKAKTGSAQEHAMIGTSAELYEDTMFIRFHAGKTNSQGYKWNGFLYSDFLLFVALLVKTQRKMFKNVKDLTNEEITRKAYVCIKDAIKNIQKSTENFTPPFSHLDENAPFEIIQRIFPAEAFKFLQKRGLLSEKAERNLGVWVELFAKDEKGQLSLRSEWLHAKMEGLNQLSLWHDEERTSVKLGTILMENLYLYKAENMDLNLYKKTMTPEEATLFVPHTETKAKGVSIKLKRSSGDDNAVIMQATTPESYKGLKMVLKLNSPPEIIQHPSFGDHDWKNATVTVTRFRLTLSEKPKRGERIKTNVILVPSQGGYLDEKRSYYSERLGRYITSVYKFKGDLPMASGKKMPVVIYACNSSFYTFAPLKAEREKLEELFSGKFKAVSQPHIMKNSEMIARKEIKSGKVYPKKDKKKGEKHDLNIFDLYAKYRIGKQKYRDLKNWDQN